MKPCCERNHNRDGNCDRHKPRIYIAGPMTGYLHYNAPRFLLAQAIWEQRGFEALTPLEANSLVWRKHFGRDFDPFNDKCDYGDPLLAEMFGSDLAMMCSCPNLALLPGWLDSQGTARELATAILLRKNIYESETAAPLNLSCDIRFHITDRVWSLPSR